MTGTLYQHQTVAARWLKGRRAGLLWGDPGTGKTASSITALIDAGAKNALILSPLAVLGHWQREFLRWGSIMARILRKPQDVHPRSFCIVNPDKLYDPHMMNALKSVVWDTLILDESQYFKNVGAKRTKLVYGQHGLVHHAHRTWCLSGTPCPKGPVDLYPMLRTLFPTVLNGLSFDGFVENYHVLDQDKVRILGVRRMDDLRARMEPFVLRQTEADCLDLPPLRWGTIPLRRDTLVLDSEALDRAMKQALLLGWEGLSEQFLMQLLHDQAFHLSSLRSFFAAAKAVPVAQLAADELEAGRPKLVIYSWHLLPLYRLRDALRHFQPAFITGESTGIERTRAIERFQTDPACRVMIAQGTAGGVGITLHAANECWLLDTPWTPGPIVQAVKRLHRIGQTKSVLARIFTVENSIDDAVTQAMLRTARMITALQPDAAEGILL